MDFLRTGKIKLAEPSKMQGLEQVSAKFGGGSFIPSTIPRMKELMKEEEIIVIYAIKDKSTPIVIGHYFVGMKKNGVLHLFDGQSGEYVIISQTDRKYANFIQRKYLGFQYLKVR